MFIVQVVWALLRMQRSRTYIMVKSFQVGTASTPDTKGAKAIGRNAISIIDGSQKLGASDLSKLKGKFSASCMAGYIFNKPNKEAQADSTDIF